MSNTSIMLRYIYVYLFIYLCCMGNKTRKFLPIKETSFLPFFLMHLKNIAYTYALCISLTDSCRLWCIRDYIYEYRRTRDKHTHIRIQGTPAANSFFAWSRIFSSYSLSLRKMYYGIVCFIMAYNYARAILLYIVALTTVNNLGKARTYFFFFFCSISRSSDLIGESFLFIM